MSEFVIESDSDEVAVEFPDYDVYKERMESLIDAGSGVSGVG